MGKVVTAVSFVSLGMDLSFHFVRNNTLSSDVTFMTISFSFSLEKTEDMGTMKLAFLGDGRL